MPGKDSAMKEAREGQGKESESVGGGILNKVVKKDTSERLGGQRTA